MKLIRKHDNLSDFAIYELNSKEQELFHGNFAVSQGTFCDLAIKDFGEVQLLKELKAYEYEGIFQTYLEAYYHIKLVEAKSMINHMEWKRKETCGIDCFDKKNHRMITENSDKLNIMFYPLTEEKPNMKDHLEFD